MQHYVTYRTSQSVAASWEELGSPTIEPQMLQKKLPGRNPDSFGLAARALPTFPSQACETPVVFSGVVHGPCSFKLGARDNTANSPLLCYPASAIAHFLSSHSAHTPLVKSNCKPWRA
jgi:hypothetical protein